jgi:predicted nucleic acid-binding protein
LESEAVLGIISYLDSDQIELLSSEALLYESDQSTMPIRKEHTIAVLVKAKRTIVVTEEEKSRAANFVSYGMKPLDALHLALAEAGGADYFCTCDDKLLRTSKLVKELKVKVLNPVELVQEIDQ